MPAWVKAGFEDYQARLPKQLELSLREINLPERNSGQPVARLKEQEGQRLLSGVAADDLIVALDQRGKPLSSQQLAVQLQGWMDDRRNVSLLIGGPDGLANDCLQQSQLKWSLSNATLPHMLVRVILAEQIYRAWTITQGHPYHRE